MPLTFTDEKLVIYATEVWDYRAPLPNESLDEYRKFIADTHHKVDALEAHEVRTGRPWSKWTDSVARTPAMIVMMTRIANETNPGK
jgi:hypothetical protein